MSPSARAVLTESVNETNLVTLQSSVRAEAVAANDRGRVDDSRSLEHIWLQLKRSPEAQQALDQFTAELHDSSSPNFHKWITSAEYGKRFGLAPSDMSAATGWLESHGFKVNHVYPNLVVDFSGTARQIRETFHTEIHRLSVAGENHIANISSPRIPAALAPIIAGVFSLNDFRPRSLLRPAKPAYTYNASYQLLVPEDIATIYDLNPAFAAGYSGQGQTIALVEPTDLYSNGDFYYFRTAVGLAKHFPEGTYTVSHPGPGTSGACADPGVNNFDAEATIDVEWASAAAPSANILLASCASTDFNFGVFIALENLLTNEGKPPQVVSISYDSSEAQTGSGANLYVSELYNLAVSEGVSIFVATGDWGAAGSDENQPFAQQGIGINGFGSTPFNVAVGGTDFADSYFGVNARFWSPTNGKYYGSALSYIPEIPWNDSCASTLLAQAFGYAKTYGADGFCNSATGQKDYVNTAAGSGGPSGCAAGTPSTAGVVSGTCAGYSKPSWQAGLAGNPRDGVRDVPDVSLFAANGIWGHYYSACYSDPSRGGGSCYGEPSTWAGFGGTSVSTPIMAGIQALINQYTGENWGNPNPTYYELAKAEYGATGSKTCDSDGAFNSKCIFHDITLGDMDVPCQGGIDCYLPGGIYGVLSTSSKSYEPAYGTHVGWDFATGIGSVDGWNLMKGFKAATSARNEPGLYKPVQTAGGN